MMQQNKIIILPWKFERDAPPFEENDIKSPESLIRYLLKNYTKKGDKVFDPFTGLGTTMFTAEEMGRVPFGIEAEEKKFEWVAGQMTHWTHMICDDAYNLNKYDLPKMDLVIACPPYMESNKKWNPLYGGDPKYTGYAKYLKRMGQIFSKTKNIMKKNTPLIIQLDNLNCGKNFTPLVHDITNLLQKDFVQIDELTILWKSPKSGYPLTNCLIFKKR